ncbi:polysaccharide biosynthesis C-terminal domain-containing protein [Halorubrum ruber]|uniref:Polysaccharide biosynthesis C-terminal domain-containing protein n=1 Tax=Halorubrum ruber TaxID=2982524 RepID=A0A8T8LIZ6_9EURY|nr:polysaccharide biosynthesis C-terminal domain-containing protein [Halorubrum ruber]QUO46916.1 polysaccharide biosynthesis C-terminal domain-containing protein [Halorubrum ruber]
MREGKVAISHFAAQVIRSVAGFGTTFFIARYLGAGDLGIYSQALALLFWIKLPGGSITSAASKRMSESDTRSAAFFSAGLVILTLYAALVGVFMLLLRDYIDSYIGLDIALVLALLIAVNLIFDLVKSGFVGLKRVSISGWIGTAEQLLRLGGQISFVLAGFMVIGLVYGHALSLLAFCVLGLLMLRSELTIPTRQAFSEIRSFAQYSWLGSLKSVSLSWADLLVLGLFVSDQLVGVYQASWTLSSFLAIVGGSIATTLFPEISALDSENQYDRVRDLLDDALIYTGIFLIPGAFGAFVIGERLLRIYSPEFSIGNEILVILIAARMVHAFGGQALNALNALDYPDIAFRINGIFITTNVVLNVILVYQFSWYGAATATLLSSLLYFVISWREIILRLGGVEFPILEVGKQVVASTIMMLGLYPIISYTPPSNYLTIGLVGLGASVYALVLLGISKQVRAKVFSLLPASVNL